MTDKVKRPGRLDISDMPRDKAGVLGGLRGTLVSTFNRCRNYPAKMAVLKSVLKYTYNRVVAWEKAHAEYMEEQAKLKLESEARKVGLELDRRKSLGELEAIFKLFLEKNEEDRAAALTEAKEKFALEAEKKHKAKLQKEIEEAELVIKRNKGQLGAKDGE